MNDTIKAAKAELRRTIMAQRDALTSPVRAAARPRLALLAEAREFRAYLPQKDGFISGYWPIRSEIDPLPLMLALQAQGYRLAFPRIAGGLLSFHAVEAMDSLIPGAFGTREPSGDQPEVSPGLILTPLLAFDDQGGRLGYGKGYYDGAFTRHPQARRVGIAFSCQRVESVPREAHDALLERVFVV